MPTPHVIPLQLADSTHLRPVPDYVVKPGDDVTWRIVDAHITSIIIESKTAMAGPFTNTIPHTNCNGIVFHVPSGIRQNIVWKYKINFTTSTGTYTLDPKIAVKPMTASAALLTVSLLVVVVAITAINLFISWRNNKMLKFIKNNL